MPDMTKEVLFEIVNRDVFQNDAYEDIVVEYDNDSRRITFSIYKYYDGVDLSTKDIVVRYVNALSQYDEYLVNDLTTKDDYIYFTWMVNEKALMESGEIEFDVLFFDENGYKWHTKPATLKVERGLIEVEYTATADTSDLYAQWRVEASQNLKEINQIKNDAQQSADNANTSATNAATSETNADNSAKQAATSATSASTSATNAAKSAENSANFATEASGYKDEAATSAQESANNVILSKSWAVGGTGTRPDEDSTSAKYFAEIAKSVTQGACGYYPTPEALRNAYPTSEAGYWAIVGSTNTIWIWSANSNKWVNTSVEADSLYTKSDIDTMLSGYYTKTQTDTKLSDYYTKTQVDNTFNSYYTKTQTDTKLNDYYTKTQTNNTFYTKTQVDNTFTSYYTKTQSDEITSKIAPMYTATYSVTGWSSTNTTERANGYMYKQTVTLVKDVSTSPNVTAQSQFMTVGATTSTGVASTDESLMEALGIINAGYTVSGNNQVTTLVTEKPTVDIPVKWAIKG